MVSWRNYTKIPCLQQMSTDYHYLLRPHVSIRVLSKTQQ